MGSSGKTEKTQPLGNARHDESFWGKAWFGGRASVTNVFKRNSTRGSMIEVVENPLNKGLGRHKKNQSSEATKAKSVVDGPQGKPGQAKSAGDKYGGADKSKPLRRISR